MVLEVDTIEKTFEGTFCFGCRKNFFEKITSVKNDFIGRKKEIKTNKSGLKEKLQTFGCEELRELAELKRIRKTISMAKTLNKVN